MVTQLQIDAKRREDREETMRQGWEKLDEWARAIGATKIRCWAMNEKVASLFERFGLEPKDYVLMETEVPEPEVPEEN
jgi:hypothetical protein